MFYFYCTLTQEYDVKLRVPYWRNPVTNDVTYEEPRDIRAEKQVLFGNRVRVYWVAQDEWFEGVLVDYHKRKNRFRIDYFDGDHEWIDIYREMDRIQIQLPDGSWVIFAQYRTDVELNDKEIADAKRSEDRRKEEAYSDAYQWKQLSEPGEFKVIFISDKTGEIRSGVFDSANWIIQVSIRRIQFLFVCLFVCLSESFNWQDDGYGYPCFYNAETGALEYDDPRFENNVQASLQHQRDFVMQVWLIFNRTQLNISLSKFNHSITGIAILYIFL